MKHDGFLWSSWNSRYQHIPCLESFVSGNIWILSILQTVDWKGSHCKAVNLNTPKISETVSHCGMVTLRRLKPNQLLLACKNGLLANCSNIWSKAGACDPTRNGFVTLSWLREKSPWQRSTRCCTLNYPHPPHPLQYSSWPVHAPAILSPNTP